MRVRDVRQSRSCLEFAEAYVQLRQRIEKIEAATNSAREAIGPLSRFLKWIGPALPTLIVSTISLILGFWIKDSVDLAIRQRQLDLSYVKEMQPLLEKFGHTGEQEIDLPGKERLAVLIAGFGEPAVMPLANELRYGGNRLQSAEAGMHVLSLTHPESVCRLLPTVLHSVPPILGWQGHRSVSKVLASAKCVRALPVLEAHLGVLTLAGNERDMGIRRLIVDKPEVANIKEWEKSLNTSVTLLKEASK